MIPIDRTNYREVRDAIEKRGGRLIVRRNLLDVRRWSDDREKPFAWLSVSLDSCSGLVGIFGAEITEPATLEQITDRLAKILDQIEAFFAATVRPARIAEEAALEIEAIRNETSRLINDEFRRRYYGDPQLRVPQVFLFPGTDF